MVVMRECVKGSADMQFSSVVLGDVGDAAIHLVLSGVRMHSFGDPKGGKSGITCTSIKLGGCIQPGSL